MRSVFTVYCVATRTSGLSGVSLSSFNELFHFNKEICWIAGDNLIRVARNIMFEGKLKQDNVIVLHCLGPIPIFVNGFCTSKKHMIDWKDPSLRRTL